jgi:NAD(P)-dependent dehydrogenase (short-subunit alcohol dehydrogenase family)
MGRYSATFINPQGAGDARPTALQIIHDEELEGKLDGKVIVITGATSGIGLETARALAATGATLFLTGRNIAKAKVALAEVLETNQCTLIEMHNDSFASVKEATSSILEKSGGQVNILIGNAGVMGVHDLQLTQDGHEKHFATNHLGHFLLFQLLKPALLSSSSPEFHSRVVMVSSSAQRMSNLLESNNYNFQKGNYNMMLAYANSKLANIYMSNEIERRYGSLGLHATSLHPGGINTDISRHIGSDFVDSLMSDPNLLKIFKSPEQGAATTVVAAVGREWENKGGKYLEDCEESKKGIDDYEPFGTGYVSQTYQPSEEKRLWSDSLHIVGIVDDAKTGNL